MVFDLCFNKIKKTSHHERAMHDSSPLFWAKDDETFEGRYAI